MNDDPYPNPNTILEAAVEPTYVGFWRRVVASLIDSILLGAITLPVLYLIYGPAYFQGEQLLAGRMDFLISYLLPAVAVILFWIYQSATPGKMLMRAKIVDARTGEKPSRGQFIGRYFGYFVSMLPLMLGIVWIAFDKRKQGWHDKLAKTIVVRD